MCFVVLVASKQDLRDRQGFVEMRLRQVQEARALVRFHDVQHVQQLPLHVAFALSQLVPGSCAHLPSVSVYRPSSRGIPLLMTFRLELIHPWPWGYRISSLLAEFCFLLQPVFRQRLLIHVSEQPSSLLPDARHL